MAHEEFLKKINGYHLVEPSFAIFNSVHPDPYSEY